MQNQCRLYSLGLGVSAAVGGRAVGFLSEFQAVYINCSNGL